MPISHSSRTRDVPDNNDDLSCHDLYVMNLIVIIRAMSMANVQTCFVSH